MNRREWLVAAAGMTLAGCGKREIVRSFTESDGSEINPERGFYVQVATEEDNDFPAIRKAGSSLVLLTLDLRKFRERPLTDAGLERLDLALDAIRQAGMKVIFRAAYGFTDNDYRVDPRNLDLIRSHIRRISAVLTRHASIVWAVQAGMLGPWGEWHGSNHGDPPSLEARKCVVGTWLEALPAPVFVLVRRPRFLRDLFPLQDDPGLTRTGWHNDALLALPDDMGTYDEEGWNRSRELEWSFQQGARTPFGGETVPASEATGAEQVLNELKQLRISYLNRGYHPGTLERWKQLKAGTGNLYAEIENKLGYRWVARKLVCGETTRLELVNLGFAPIYSERLAEAAWLDPKTLKPDHFPVPTGLDLRGCGGGSVLKAGFKMPSSPAGGLLGIRFPDPAPDLREDGRYAIRLMNRGMRFQVESGWNIVE